jgi:hypothetical protein
MYLLIPLTGAAIGPIVGGFVQYSTTWRCGVLGDHHPAGPPRAALTVQFSNIYAHVLLRWRAEELRVAETEDPHYDIEIEMRDSGRSTMWNSGHSLARIGPLALHRIIQIQAIQSGINCGLLYFALATFESLSVSTYG